MIVEKSLKYFRHWIGRHSVTITTHIDTHSFGAVLKRPELQINAVDSNAGLPKVTHQSMIPDENRALRYGSYTLILFSPLEEPLVPQERIRFNS